MIPYIGDFAEDATIYHYFNTFSSDDPSASVTITNLADTDIYVYKDGSVTDIVTDGASVVIDFDSRTGVHKLTIDTSAHADYAVGSDYMVLIEGTTVDAGTVTAGIFTFSIENRYNAAADDLANGTDGLGALKTLIDTLTTNVGTVDTVVDRIEVDTQDLQTQVGTAGAGLTNLGGSGNNWNVGKTGYSLTATTGLGNQTANITGTIDTVTDLTNLPSITANWLTAAGIAASALDGKGDWELAGVAPTVAEITADVWDEATATARTAGTYGQLFKDNVDATISSRMATTHLDATAGKLDGVALADTITTYTGNTLQTGDVTTAINDLANGTDGLGALKTLIDTVNTDLGNGTDGLGALKTLIDALQTDLDTLTDTSAEPTGVPAASATLLTKVGYLYMALRNQVDVTATKKTFYGDDGVAEWEKDLSDDTTTYSESEGNAI